MNAPKGENITPVRVGITMGDPNGIGPELILKCLKDERVLQGCDPVIYGDEGVLLHYREALDFDGPEFGKIEDSRNSRPERVDLISTWEGDFEPEPGRATPKAGKFARQALERATADMAEARLDALLTAPLNKHSIGSEERPFPGHTEYLTEYAHMESSLMLMVSEGLRVGLASGHIPLQKVPSQLTQEGILQKLRILEESLRTDFLIEKPLIAVLGLNPHAGESGVLGNAEKTMIGPGIQRAREEMGIYAFGPFPADGFFGSEELGKYHGVLAMYHDQGLTPFKALTFERGVNFTAGLPIVRTSPDHGTAFGIAGKGVASVTSFRNALFLAMDLYKNRQLSKRISADPLEPQRRSSGRKRGEG